jgi:two-component system chemotaxis response regulator CheB
MIRELRFTVRAAARANVRSWSRRTAPGPSPSATKQALAASTNKVIAIGASAGGTDALRVVLSQFPATGPGVVVVQHMPPEFSRLFAEHLNKLCAMDVKEAETGDRVRSGLILIAPGAKQMTVKRSGGECLVSCTAGPKVSGHAPSVDVLFNSVADHIGANAVGVILTGMGSDGPESPR